jgi:hypothetical protein
LATSTTDHFINGASHQLVIQLTHHFINSSFH